MRDRDFFGELLETMGDGLCLADEPMSRHVTFRTGGPADYYVRPAIGQVGSVRELCNRRGVPCHVIGNGSNLLVGDGGVRGLVMEIGKGADAVRTEGERVTAQAGALLSSVAREAASLGLSGLEFASGIPGGVGGAVVMNAGAYGGEMAQVLESVRVLAPDGEEMDLPAEELGLGYRHSRVPEEGLIVIEATMRLRQGDPGEIRARMEELRERRSEKQPLEYPSAGSTFKRPPGHFAGKLIQDAGLRGYRVGDAQVSEKHCGFIVNLGGATSAEILALIRDVQDIVERSTGIRLEPEVRMLGEF